MKPYWTTALALLCTLLVVCLVVVKLGARAQHEKDADALADCSNRWDAAQTKIAIFAGRITAFSNDLAGCQSAGLVLSNEWITARSNLTVATQQLTNLNQQVAAVSAENQARVQRIADLTNQVAGLTHQLALTEASLAATHQALAQARQDYGRLEDRLRQDVAERLIVERRFNNQAALEAQLDLLKKQPVWGISATDIFAGLNVEVRSNGTFRVISPD
jgi:chromosome segregation ATPase